MSRRARRRTPGEELFFSVTHLHGSPATVRRFLPELINLIWQRRVDPGKAFDLTLPLNTPPTATPPWTSAAPSRPAPTLSHIPDAHPRAGPRRCSVRPPDMRGDVWLLRPPHPHRHLPRPLEQLPPLCAQHGTRSPGARQLDWRREHGTGQQRSLGIGHTSGEDSPQLGSGRPAMRTEVTDRMLIFGERHLHRVLAGYAAHYNTARPHRALQLRPPRPTSPVAEPVRGRIRRRPILGGLLDEYEMRLETAGQAPCLRSGTPQGFGQRVPGVSPGRHRQACGRLDSTGAGRSDSGRSTCASDLVGGFPAVRSLRRRSVRWAP